MDSSQLDERDALKNVPSGTVTFLFTDIEGSTKLLERLREQYATVLEDQRQILRAAFAKWNGCEMDTQGDSFFAVFPRAIDAVCCAVEAQRSLSEHKWPQEAMVRVRMGMHTGEPIVVRTGYVGIDVHRAARIAAAGHGGQVLLSQTSRDLIYQDLPKGTFLRDLGMHKLKDIRYPQQIFQLDIEGLAVEFPPLKTLSTEQEPPTPGEAPYKGLQFFSEGDAEWFFGREEITARLAQAVKEQRFLAVVGASGSGKSSIVRAGLVPALKHSANPHWVTYILTPSAHPLEALAICLTRDSESANAATTLMDDLIRDPRNLHMFVRKMLSYSSGPSAIHGNEKKVEERALVVVDQFEELFTLCRDETERCAFVDNLLVAAETEGTPATVLVALRADFYDHLGHYAGLREMVAKHQEYIGAMSAEELRMAIEEPAKRGGWEFSPGLVDLMLHDVGAAGGCQPEPGALPLLSHALLETWKRRRGNLMNLRAYSEAGGVSGAIARTAENVYLRELTADQQEIARNIFLRLTELGEGTQDTRRRATISELIPPAPYGDPKEVEAVLVKLADARLITTSEGIAEVAHEALIREWPMLREWLTQDREGLRVHRHLTESAQEWRILECDPGALYRGARLAQALEWSADNPRQLNAEEQDFLEASKEATEREQAEREAQRQRELEAAQKLAETETQAAQKLRRRATYLLLALILAGILAAAAVVFGQQANQNAQLASQNLTAAQSASTQAVAQQATAESERQRAELEAGQRATQQAIAVDQAHLASSRELAAAAVSNLIIDPERSILLSVQALKTADTLEAENALHQAILASRLRATIHANQDRVYSIAISPDGRRLASAGQDGTVEVRTLDGANASSTNKPSLTLADPIDFDVAFETCGYTLAFSPDGTRLAAISEKNSVRIWDAMSGELLQTLTGHEGNVYGLSFSPDGKRLATASADGTAKVWDVATGNLIQTMAGHEAAVYLGIFSPDSKYLVTAGDDYTLRFWNLSAARGVPASKQVFSITLSPAEGPAGAMVFSPDGKFLAVGAATVGKIWNFAELLADHQAKPLLNLYGHKNAINSLLYTPDGTRLVTTSPDGMTKIWDTSTGQELFTLPKGDIAMALSPDGTHLFTAGPSVWEWDISPAGSYEWWVVSPAWRGRLSLDGKQLASIFLPDDAEGHINFRLWDLLPSGIQEQNRISITHGARVSAQAISPDLLKDVTIGADMTAKIWDAKTGQLLETFSISPTVTTTGHSNYVFGLDISPDGSRMVTGSDDGTAIIWDLASGKPLLTLSGHSGEVRGVTFSPDGARVATASFDKTARVWDAVTGKLLQTFTGHEQKLIKAVFSPDGRQLVTGSADTTAKVWDIQTGKELLTLNGHTGTIFDVNFSPDSSRIATGSTDGTVKVWDASTGQVLLTVPGFYVQFGPEGKRLITFTADGLARGFYLDIEELIALAQTRVTRSLTTEECKQYLHTAECP